MNQPYDISPVELLVGVWILVFAAVILLCVIVAIIDLFHSPPSWWVQRHIPDTYDPNDWQPKGRDAKANRP